jgi:hypothetical protein
MTRHKFSGLYTHFDNVERPNAITIDTDRNTWACGFLDVYTSANERIKVQFKNKPDVNYRTGKDSSDGLYEIIEFSDNADSWYSNTILGNNRIEWTHCSIQTWDRQEIFVSFVYEHKQKGRIRATTEHESCIFKLSDADSSKFAAWLEGYIK